LSGYDPNKSHNNPAEQVQLRMPPQQAIYIPQPPSMPPYVREDGLDSERLMEKISSWNEVMQGIYPKGSPAGVTIQSLQEVMGMPLKKAARHFGWFLQDLGRGMLKLLQFVDPMTIYTVIDKDSNQATITLDDLNVGSVAHIRVIDGSMLPTSRIEKYSEARQNMQAGLYDLEAALKYCDDPQADGVIQRNAENNQLKSVIQQQQQLIGTLQQQLEIESKLGGTNGFSTSSKKSNYQQPTSEVNTAAYQRNG
jgi:hypothetical protein